MKATRIIIVLFLFVLIEVSLSGISMAEPPVFPTVPPHSGGGGGGTYTPPKFVPYTKPVNSSDGTTIGHLEGKDFNSVQLWVQKNGTANGMDYMLTITGELSHDPPAGVLVDIAFEAGDASGMPEGLGYGMILGKVKVTMTPADGWDFRSGPKYALSISGDALKSIDPDRGLYISCSDGSQYQILKLGSAIGDGSLSAEFNPQGHDGTFTIYSAVVVTPTPAPTVEPTPEATQMPEAQGGVSPMVLVASVAALGIVAALSFFLGTRFK